MPVVPPDTEKMGGSERIWSRTAFRGLSRRFSVDVRFFQSDGVVLAGHGRALWMRWKEFAAVSASR